MNTIIFYMDGCDIDNAVDYFLKEDPQLINCHDFLNIEKEKPVGFYHKHFMNDNILYMKKYYEDLNYKFLELPIDDFLLTLTCDLYYNLNEENKDVFDDMLRTARIFIIERKDLASTFLSIVSNEINYATSEIDLRSDYIRDASYLFKFNRYTFYGVRDILKEKHIRYEHLIFEENIPYEKNVLDLSKIRNLEQVKNHIQIYDNELYQHWVANPPINEKEYKARWSESILLLDDKGNYKGYSHEEIHSRQLNNWKTWWCAAGISSLYISHDGNVFNGTCQVGGWKGNIFNDGMAFQKTWIECTANSCACGSDMQVPKVKHKHDIPKNQKYYIDEVLTWVNQRKEINEEDHTKVMPATDFHFQRECYLQVLWDIGRRCNFDCFYCAPSLHNNYEAHKTLGSLENGYKILKDLWIGPNRRVKFTFTGGEPTFNPNYLDFLNLLISDRHVIHTVTNGTRTSDYYRKLINMSSIGISYHFAGDSKDIGYQDRILKTIEEIIDEKKNNIKADQNWFGLRIMVPPGYVDQAKILKEKILNIPDNEKCILNVSAVHKINKDELYDYDPEDLKWIQDNA